MLFRRSRVPFLMTIGVCGDTPIPRALALLAALSYRPLLVFVALCAFALCADARVVACAHAAETVRYETLEGGVRLAADVPAGSPPTLLVIYACPNGSSAEETMGRRPRAPAEWKYDIQHVQAQVRSYRQRSAHRSVALAVLQAPQKSWPAWRSATQGAPAKARALIGDVRRKIAPDAPVALLAHSGGGSLLFALIEAGPLPPWIERIGFLDANYSFDHTRHASPLLSWLDAEPKRRLVIVAYDDRFVTMDGKPVVGPDGGTQRATSRMRSAMDAHRPLTKSLNGDCDRWTDAAGQIDVRVHRNYANAILHTALVGDMNGVLHALTFGEPNAVPFGPPRAYTQFVEPSEPGPDLQLPPRRDGESDGLAFAGAVASLPTTEREAAIRDAILGGNVPDFMRRLRSVRYTARDAGGSEHAVTIWVTADVLSVGHDDDFVRVPLTPATAQRIADAAGCMLPTPRISDEVWRAAECKLQPRPMLSAREAWTTFVAHNTIIQEQRRTVPNGPIVAGHKKDIVVSRDLAERAGRVAIYGWHRDDGKPIQPVSLAHAATYVDYSHGVRLVWRTAEVDGKPCNIVDALRDPNLAYLFSDEGPVQSPRYGDPAP